MEKVDIPYLNKGILLNEVPYGLDFLLTEDNTVKLTKNFQDYCKGYSVKMFLKKADKKSEEIFHNLALEYNVQFEYVDVKKALRLTSNIIFTLKLVLYGLTFLIILIGITSMVNIMNTSMELRGFEFALLKSAGLTNGKMLKILFYESLFIVSKGFIYSILPCYFISQFLYSSISNSLVINKISISSELVIGFVLSFLIVYLTVIIQHLKFQNKAIIPVITKQNI